MNWLTIRWFKECVELIIYNNNEDDDDLIGLITDGSLVRFPLNLCSQFF